ncbi:hypothetical protein CAFE_30820 [Caprobacter fermentans]|uniref:Uncharacterized protein n=1 Tax=Caproicibacter fermentans TaxID=2576756 RepID=A0A6N8I328_9FIRM|nr:hypothetical protein [Caproicibacter fermentans]MVB12348.1 hypothetical protein [Caproicibacter fermentans]
MNYKKLLDHCEKRARVSDNFSSLQTELVLLRMEIRCTMQRYLSIRDEIRDLERRQKKLKDSGITVSLLAPWTEKRKNDLQNFHRCLVACGELVMSALDIWQECGATLKDLCNFCNRKDYEDVRRMVEKYSETKFSDIMFVHNLDYPVSDRHEWLEDTVDAPFTHAVKEFMLDRMINTPEGHKASDEAMKAVFPDLWENALVRQVDEDGSEYFTDREGNRIDIESSR